LVGRSGKMWDCISRLLTEKSTWPLTSTKNGEDDIQNHHCYVRRSILSGIEIRNFSRNTVTVVPLKIYLLQIAILSFRNSNFPRSIVSVRHSLTRYSGSTLIPPLKKGWMVNKYSVSQFFWWNSMCYLMPIHLFWCQYICFDANTSTTHFC